MIQLFSIQYNLIIPGMRPKVVRNRFFKTNLWDNLFLIDILCRVLSSPLRPIPIYFSDRVNFSQDLFVLYRQMYSRYTGSFSINVLSKFGFLITTEMYTYFYHSLDLLIREEIFYKLLKDTGNTNFDKCR